MAGKIKGITIEVGANVEPLSNALSDITKKSREVDKELKNVNQALKLDPGNAEQVARKLELLEQKASLAEDKVQRLKQAQAQMDAQGVDKASREYQSLTTEIVKAEGAYKDIVTQIDRTKTSFEEVGEGSRRLETFLKATGQTADDLTSILGSKLVDAIKSGQLGAAGYQTVLDKLATSFTGAKDHADEFRQILDKVDDGDSLDKVKEDLESIGKVNISGLGAEFEEISQKSTALDQELKEINNSLKLDPGNIDLCAQKQEVLTQAVAQSETKLQALNQRFSELKSNNVDLNDEEFRSLQREISNTESSLNSYKTQLTDLEQAQNRLNTYFDATGTKAQDFANVLGSDLVSKIERGEASSQELAHALDKIGNSATQNKGDIDRFKQTLDSVDSGVSLDRIRSELNQLGSEFNEGEAKAGSFSSALKSIADSNAISALKDMGDMVGEVADKLGEISGAATEAAGTVEQTQSQIQMSMGVTEEEAAAVADHVHNVWAQNFGETQEDVTEVMVQIQRAMGDMVNDNNIEDVTAKFMTLQAQGVDTDDAIRGVKSTMEAWGISAEEALDLIQTGTINVYDPAHELGDIFGEYAPLMKQAGYSGSEFVTALKEGMDNGAYSVDKVADLIKEMGIRLSDGSIASAVTDLDSQFSGMGTNFQGVMEQMTASGASPKETFRALVEEINKLPDAQAQATAASALFGTQGEDAGLKVLNAVALAGDEFSDYIGAADQAKEANETAVGSMQRSWENFTSSFAPLGEAMANVANTILEKVTPAVEQFSQTLSGLFSGEIDPSQLLDQIKSAATNISDIVKEKFPEWKQMALDAIKNFVDGFLEGLPDLLSNVGDMGSNLIQTLMEWLPKILEFGVQIIGTIVQSLIEHAPELLQGAAELIGKLLEGFIAGFPQFMEGVGQLLSTILTTLGGWAGSLIEAGGQIVSNIINGIGPALGLIGELFVTVLSGLWELVSPVFQPLIDGIKGAWDGLWSGIQTGWNTIVEWFTSIFTAIGTTIGELWGQATSTVSETWNTIWTGIQTAWETIAGWFSTIFSGLNLGELWNAAVSGIQTAWDTIWSAIQTAWTTVSGWFSGIFSGLNLGQLWNDAISGIQSGWDNVWSGVQNAWDKTKSWVSDTFNGVKDKISQTWDDSEISTEDAWNNMQKTVVGCAQGMDAESTDQLSRLDRVMADIWKQSLDNTDITWDDIESAVRQQASGMNQDVQDQLPQILSSMKDNWEASRSTTDDKWGQIRDTVTTKAQELKDNATEAWNNLTSKAGEIWENIKSSVFGKAQELKDNLVGKWNEIVSDFTGAWDGLKQKAADIWEDVKQVVADGVQRLKDLMNFNWELPHISLPHFSISGEFSLNPPSIPSISVDWYKKGGILTKPLIFGMNGNHLLGGGEAGAEAVAPLSDLTGMMEDAVKKSVDMTETNNLLKQLIENQNPNIQVVLDSGQLVGEIAPKMDRQLGIRQKRRARQ